MKIDIREIIEERIRTAPLSELLAMANEASPPEPMPLNGAQRFEAFEDGADGWLVRDKRTGLVWTRSHVGDGRMNWSDAKKACAELGEGWRLPTANELLSLVDYERHEPAIDPIFECESAAYWTSTPWASSPSGDAWGVSFGLGSSGFCTQGFECFVRAVRSSQ